MSYLSTEDILTSKQYGFRPAGTTTDCFVTRFNIRNNRGFPALVHTSQSRMRKIKRYSCLCLMSHECK